jgi:hypothetical protein
MNFNSALQMNLKKRAAFLLIISIMFMGWGQFAQAATQLASIKDTLSDSDLSATSNHVIVFDPNQTLAAGENILVTFDPSGQTFNLTGVTSADISLSGTGWTYVTAVGSCSGAANEVYFNSINTSTDVVTLTVCAGDTVTDLSLKTISFSGTNKITNPSSAGSKAVRVNYGSNGTNDEVGTAMVAIIDDVDVTAAVSESLTFTIASASGSVLGSTLAGNSTATTIPFGTLTPDVNKTEGQTLTVATNAANGFAVTVFANQTLTSSTTADIDEFVNDSATSTPTTWSAPSCSLATGESTYGHWGIATDDSGIADYSSQKFAGDFTSSGSPKTVLSHNGPADGNTTGQGTTKVLYRVEVCEVQEAASDYTATLTYVATPTF